MAMEQGSERASEREGSSRQETRRTSAKANLCARRRAADGTTRLRAPSPEPKETAARRGQGPIGVCSGRALWANYRSGTRPPSAGDGYVMALLSLPRASRTLLGLGSVRAALVCLATASRPAGWPRPGDSLIWR